MKHIDKLMILGIGGLGACFGIAHMFREKVSSQIKGNKVYEDAMEMLRQNRGAVYLLGQPITDSLAKFHSIDSLFGSHTEVKVRVSGPKSKGILFFTVEGDNLDSKNLSTVQLQVGKDDSKRLVIKSAKNEKGTGS